MSSTDQSSSPTRSVAEWRTDIRSAVSRGELLEAYDLAERALADFPDEPVLLHLAILTLSRAGATHQARARYDRSHLRELVRDQGDSALRIDVESLDARITKDEAFQASGTERVRLLADAAARYEAIFRRSGDYYPGINAATLWLLAGDSNRAQALASEVLARCEVARASSNDSYYIRATEAEAALVLGRPAAARAALEIAARLHGGDLSAAATTRQQLRLVCAARGLSDDLLAPLNAPAVIHFSGHLIGPRFLPAAEDSVRARIAELLDRHKVGFGYGSLAAGADILFAEELLKRNAEIHIAMPFEVEEFKRVSVAPCGAAWLARFDECWRHKSSVIYATTDQYLGDDSLFGYASQIAMGLALLRARFLDAPVRQIAIWDGGGVGGGDPTAGAAADVSFWRSRKLPGDVIDPRIEGSAPMIPIADGAAKESPPTPKAGGRAIRAMLFGDIKGFSTLRDAQLPVFADEILGRFARVLDRHSDAILFRNTWGDGLYVVARDVESAATCAVELQQEMASLVPAEHGLPDYMALRLGGHLGPVFRVRDPVLKQFSFIGASVSRAARIEPVTPEGAVYVTEAFAAVLTTSGATGFTYEYVGQVPAAKHYGVMRMYSLRRARSDSV